MLKVGGIYVSPLEVENALLAHETILEAAVVAAPDETGLVKPKAFVVLRQGVAASQALVQAIEQFVQEPGPAQVSAGLDRIRPCMPRTATGKLRRGGRAQGGERDMIEECGRSSSLCTLCLCG